MSMNSERQSARPEGCLPKSVVCLFVLAGLGLATPLWAQQRLQAREPDIAGIQMNDLEATAHGFPSLLDLRGTQLAEGEFLQWLEHGRLHVRISYAFKDGRHVEENGVFRQQPQLVQDEWVWQESRNGATQRKFAVNFG